MGSLLTATILTYATAIEPNRPIITEIQVRDGLLARTLAGRRIALLSDLHLGPDGEPAADEALHILGETRPDLILLVGDYVEWGSGREAYQRALKFLSQLHAPLGVYAVLGDADRTSSRNSCLLCHEAGSGSPSTRHHVSFLKNSAEMIDLPNGQLRIVGLEPNFPASDSQRLQSLLTGDTPTILLSHSSRIYKGIDAAKDVLTLSGDTHGGQVWLPQWLWRLARPKPDPDHVHGYFVDGKKSLFVTRGVGTSHIRFRLGAPPEIVLFLFSGEAR